MSSRAPVERHLHWQGCYNARDLGGLPDDDLAAVRGRLLESI
jgi:hypothetical protein